MLWKRGKEVLLFYFLATWLLFETILQLFTSCWDKQMHPTSFTGSKLWWSRINLFYSLFLASILFWTWPGVRVVTQSTAVDMSASCDWDWETPHVWFQPTCDLTGWDLVETVPGPEDFIFLIFWSVPTIDWPWTAFFLPKPPIRIQHHVTLCIMLLF